MYQCHHNEQKHLHNKKKEKVINSHRTRAIGNTKKYVGEKYIGKHKGGLTTHEKVLFVKWS
jgi:hypothetical protein